MKGKPISLKDAKDSCYPVSTNADLEKYAGISTSYGGAALDPAAPAWPCGIMAATFLKKDTFGELIYEGARS